MTVQQPHGAAQVKAGTYSPHELALMMPRPNKAQYASLKEDIKNRGLIDPVILHNGRILDGVTRDAICAELNIIPSYTVFLGNDADAAAFVASKNLHRRHLTDTQRVMVAATFAPKIGKTEAASAFNVSPGAIATAGKIRRDAVPEVVRAVEAGRVFPSNALRVASLRSKAIGARRREPPRLSSLSLRPSRGK